MLTNSEQRVFRALSKIGKYGMNVALSYQPFCKITGKQGFYCRDRSGDEPPGN